jgi:hypothetical protein
MNNSGITNFNVLNTNALYIQGIKVEFGATSAYLQGEIDAIEQQLVGITAITNRIDFNQPTPLVGNLVITEENKNSVLLTAIQNINTQIASLNKLDLSALPSTPAGACVITPSTTNQALKTLIDNIDVSGLDKFDLTAIPAVPAGAIIITPTTTNQALKGLIDTNTSDIATIQQSITNINTSINAINTKLAHFSTFNYGADVMSGIADGTGFAVAVSSGSASGNGIFVYPNTTTQSAQIQLTSAQDKDIQIRGGYRTTIKGGANGTITSRNRIELGDKTDVIAIGIDSDLTTFPEIEIGCDSSISKRDSSTTLKGDVYFSDQVSSTGIYNVAPYTPVMVADTAAGVNFGNCNNFTTDPTFSGLDVLAPAGVAPITLSAGIGVIAITALAGGITLQTGGGLMSISCGAGGFLLNTGAGVMNFATGSGNINMTTAAGDINLSAGQGTGGSAGNVVINPLQKAIIQPTGSTEIYKAQFVELNDISGAPPVTANRLYQQDDALYWNGQLVQGGSGNQYVLKAGDTMTGTLVLPEADTSILTLQNLTTAPSPVTNRLYLLNNVLTFNGVAVGGGAGTFLPLAGGTMTGQLISSYDAGQVIPQLQITNTNNTAPVGGQGAAINLRNDAVGNGSIGERCGKIDFAAKDSAGAGGRTYGSIQAFINDPTSTAIDGRLSSYVTSNNTQQEMLRLISTSTSVRQVNINAQNTTIGTSALGSASTETLRVQGSTAITTTLDVPLIQNAPAIYPATSTTLVDGAVKRYRPERVFKINDYPSPLTAPTIDGEKVILLNSFGNPTNQVDSILQASDFPVISTLTFQSIQLAKYVDATANTPAMNVIVAVYPIALQVFVQPDVGGSALQLVNILQLGRNVGGSPSVADFCVTTFQNKTRIYFGGAFDVYNLPSPYSGSGTCSNFSGRVTLTWGAGVITNVSVTPMLSYSSPQDSGSFSAIDGVNDVIRCVIDVTGNSGFTQPVVSGDKLDSIVIGGFFTGIDATPSRPLQRISYYDYFNAQGGTANLYQQLDNSTLGYIQQDTQVVGTFNGGAQPVTYSSMTCDINMVYGGGTPPQDTYAATTIQIRDSSQQLLVQSANINVTLQQVYVFQIPQVTIPAGGTYTISLFISNFAQTQLNNTQYQGNASFQPYAVLNAIIPAVPIGWRPLQSSNWDVPEGADGNIYGGGLCSSGYLAFAYQGNQVITGAGSALASDSIFSVYYMSGTASWNYINEEDLIQSAQGSSPDQTWDHNNRGVNCVTGGNPILAYGAGNAVAYGELYFNTGYSSTSNFGVSYRPTPNDPYEMTDSLVIDGTSGAQLATNQLKPQFGSQSVYAVYRDDTKYPDVFFIAYGTALGTATLPFSGGVPNYSSISNAGQPITCFYFGGYSDEIGYTGAVFGTNTNLYIYKVTSGGELVIELSGCVVRTFNDTNPSQPIAATNKLTFPVNTDGGSVTLCGDTSTTPASWWAISQDGSLYYDNTLIGGSGAGGITAVTAGWGINVTTTGTTAMVTNIGVLDVQVSGAGLSVSTQPQGIYTLVNTGVTQITAGTGISISGGTGNVTINASGSGGGYLVYTCEKKTQGNLNSNVSVSANFPATYSLPNFDRVALGIATLFDLYDVGVFPAGQGYIRWTGDNPIMFNLTIPISMVIQDANSNRVSLPNYNGYDYSGFGISTAIYNSTTGMENTNNPQRLVWVGVGSIATLNQPVSTDFYDYGGELVINGTLNKNDYIQMIYQTNAIFNSGTGNHQPINTFYATLWDARVTLTCNYL